MNSRIELQQKLESILGVEKVYFQPPASVRLKYPCIVYHKDPKWVIQADNRNYVGTNRYYLLLIDIDPDTEIPDRILETFRMCSMGSPYTSENLYHYPFTLYF